jgi:hypothetical protein
VTEATPCNQCVADGRPSPRQARRRGLCTTHYNRARSDGTLERSRRPAGETAVCGVDGCTSDVKAKGMCGAHYARAARGVDLTVPLRGGHGPQCSFPACGKPTSRAGLCVGHYSQQARGKDLSPLRTYKSREGNCSASGCSRVIANDGLCRGHYERRMRTGGAPGWDAPIRTKAPHGTGHTDKRDGYRIVSVNG